ncbi:pyridoxamine 5'-phosphate oxidase family protein [Streptomyces sp. 796.1]|uniref:pyridoxamine 5'-phosphate oxidase family protein n=1 Tax=Streptomyces sp. 796.1 TaxID=3163029 RepID=UPI0039C8EB18
MSPTDAAHRLVEVSGAEALYLLEGSSSGRLVYPHRGAPALRPAAHVLAHGHLVVRAPVPGAALRQGGAPVAYHVDAWPTAAGKGAGWSLTVSGPAELLTDRDEVAHYRRTLTGWIHGPHDTLVRLLPQSVTGFRLSPAGPRP